MTSSIRNLSTILLSGVFAFTLAGAPAAAEPATEAPKEEAPKCEFETGKVIAKVVTRDDPEQSYALYLPKAYTPEKKWPIIFGFSPGARGTDPVMLFQAAAEKYGWIVVGSNNSQNGPHEPIQKAIDAMLKDVPARLAIDEKRRYASGFSGGARVSFFLACDQNFAGVIACGAGFSQGQKLPAKGSKLAVASIIGNQDFNYVELLMVEEKLKALELRGRLAVFDGQHRWPPVERATAAVRYLELIALLDSGAAAGSKAAEAMVADELADAAKLLEAKGQYMRGYGALVELARLLEPAPELRKTVTERIAAVEAGERHARENKAQVEYAPLAAELIRQLASDEKFPAAFAALDKFAGANAGTAAAEQARWLAFGCGLRLRMGGSQFHGEKRYDVATGWLKRARLIFPKDPALAYDLACAQARAGQKDDAAKTLTEAVELGFKELEHMQKDPDLDTLRDTEAYKAVIAKLEAAKAATPAAK